MTIQRVGVVGGGLMGSGITEVCARAGVPVVNVEISDEAAQKARGKVEGSLRKAESRGKLSADDLEAALERMTFAAELSALADCDLVVEAATEHEATKLELFARIGELLTQDDAILASNTSSIPIVKLSAVSGRADRVMGVHFFNPAPVMKLVELIPALTTSAETKERMHAFVGETLGKHPIEATDRAGFVVNSLLVPYILSAIRMYEGGHASAEDIDAGMVLGCGHPMGPLKLADMVGLDTLRAIGVSMYEEFKEPLHAPPPLLDRMVEAGLLGAKSGQGFYSYDA
jgi:3-hydroxybutyryl-CoA dehydrogenase